MTGRHALYWIPLVALWGTPFAQAQTDGVAATPPAAPPQSSVHFHPKGKLPSKYTVEQQQALRAGLPFEDQRDFEESRRGFIAAPPYKQIKTEAGNVAWDMGSFEFLLQGKDFDSMNPSLQRQAVLNMGYGLYEVVPGRYDIRTIQELLGHKDVKTIMIYTHVLQRGASAVKPPLDE